MEAVRKDGLIGREKRSEEAGYGVAAGRRWLTGMEGRRFHCCLVLRSFRCSKLFFFTVPQGDPPARTHIGQTDARWVVTPPNLSRCCGPARCRHVFATHRMFQPVINYDLASQRPVLGEFLRLCGEQLIVFFLPVRSRAGAERRPNRVLDACTSDTVALRCWNCCITRAAPMERTALFRVTPNLFFRGDVLRLLASQCVLFDNLAFTSKFFPIRP